MEYKRQHQNGFGEEATVSERTWRIGDCIRMDMEYRRPYWNGIWSISDSIRTDLEKRYSVSKSYECRIEFTGYGYEMCPEVADLNSDHGKINGKYKK